MAPSGGLTNDRDIFPYIEHAWNRLRDVTEEASFNLKEAMKMLQELDSSDVFGQQNQETRRKVCGKKAMSRVGRALRQLASHNSHEHAEELRTDAVRNRDDKSPDNVVLVVQDEGTQITDACDAREAGNLTGNSGGRAQEVVRRLQEQQEEKTGLVCALDGAKLAADMAKRSLSDALQQLQLKEVEKKNFLEDIACLKNKNEKLQERVEQNDIYETNKETNLKLGAQVERYKEVVARITADNMVLLMKLRHNEDALQMSKERQQQLEKEIEHRRGHWLATASAEIHHVVKGTLSQAEACESHLARLQREEGKIVSEWQIKLHSANQRLARVTAARDWLEEAIVQTRDRIKLMEDEKLQLQERLDAETLQRQNAEGDARALVLTLRETTEQVNVVKEQYSGALKEIEALGNELQTKGHEVEELLAALETANFQLETQQNVNTAIMRRKEEIEWQLLEAEVQRNKR